MSSRLKSPFTTSTGLDLDFLTLARLDYLALWYRRCTGRMVPRRAVLSRAVELLLYHVETSKPRSLTEAVAIKAATQPRDTVWGGHKLPHIEKGEQLPSWMELEDRHRPPKKTLAELLATPNRPPFHGNH